MTNLTNAEQPREYWEKRTMQAYRVSTKGGENHSWITSKQFVDYISTWYDLKKYYELHNDPNLNVEVVSEYVEISRALRKIGSDMSIDANIRDNAQSQLRDLEIAVEEAAWAGVNTSFKFKEKPKQADGG